MVSLWVLSACVSHTKKKKSRISVWNAFGACLVRFGTRRLEMLRITNDITLGVSVMIATSRRSSSRNPKW